MRSLYVTATLLAAVPAWAVATVAIADAARPAPAGGGISFEEYSQVFAPAPVDVRAAVEAGAVVLTWSPPAPVAAAGDRPAYDPVIAGYRVYRVDREGGRTRIGEVGATAGRFRDPSPGAGVRRYAVTAVQRSGQESGLSHVAEAHVP